MAKGLKRREIIGVKLESLDGNLWTWNIGGQRYRWCKLGFLEAILPDGAVRRVMYAKVLDGAVGYTCGLADGQEVACRRIADPHANGRNEK